MKIRKFLPLIGVILFIYILYKTGLKSIGLTISNINPYYGILAVLLVIPIVLLQTLKWKSILNKQGVKINFYKLLKIQLISIFYGSVTPGRLGSLLKIYYLKDGTKKKYHVCIASVVLERLLDLIMVALFALIGSLLLIKKFSSLYLDVIILLLIILIASYILLNKKRTEFLLHLMPKFLINKKIMKNIETSYESFCHSLIKPKELIIPFLITLITWIIAYTQGYIFALSLSFSTPYLQFITILALGTIAGLLPITVSGFGTREAALIALFSIYSIPQEKVVTMSILWALTVLIPIIIGLIYSIKIELPV